MKRTPLIEREDLDPETFAEITGRLFDVLRATRSQANTIDYFLIVEAGLETEAIAEYANKKPISVEDGVETAKRRMAGEIPPSGVDWDDETEDEQ